MALYTSRLIWAKEESAYGIDPADLDSSNSIVTTGLTIQPYNGDTVSLDIDEPDLGGSKSINTGPNVVLSFGVYLAASGSAGTAPYWGPLLKACMMSETEVASTSVTYKPDTSGSTSLTIYFNTDGTQHILTGARGDFSISMGRGQIPIMNFTFTGLYNAPTAAAQTLDKTVFVDPLPVTAVNTPTFSLHGYAANAESFNLSMNNNVVYRNVIGNETIFITNRNVTSDVSIEAPAIGTKDFFAAARSDNGITTGAFQIIHGTTAGQICTISSASSQITSISEANSDDLLMFNMGLQHLNTSSGDDDIVIALT